jgi:L-amino acid N-acyltransferase YncA
VNLGGAEVLLRALTPGDGPAILAFAKALPTHDLLFLRRDITRPDQVDAWLREAASGQIDTVLALQGDQIAGYASVASDGLSWTRHVRELRVMVAESMRGKHLGRILTEEAFAIAREQGAKKMIAQMTVDQRGAINVFRRLGFEPEARLHGQVMDREGHVHDLQIMGLDIDAFQSKLDAALTSAMPPT